jgi:hypothetical protein
MAALLTSREEVTSRLGRELSSEEDARFDPANADVSAHLRVIAPRIPEEEPIPDAVVGVASALVIRALATPPGSAPVSQESLGGYSVTYRSAADGMTLSDAYLAVLAPWRRPRIGSAPIDPTMAVAE